jgi:hypothetical protein
MKIDVVRSGAPRPLANYSEATIAGPWIFAAGQLASAAYAPFLQRYFFLDRMKSLGHIEAFPRLCSSAHRRTPSRRPSSRRCTVRTSNAERSGCRSSSRHRRSPPVRLHDVEHHRLRLAACVAPN